MTVVGTNPYRTFGGSTDAGGPIVLAPEHHDRPDDTLAPYQRLILVSRWCALAISAASMGNSPKSRELLTVALFVLLSVLTAVRSIQAIERRTSDRRLVASVIVEFVVVCAAISASDYWHSPLAFLLVPPLMVGVFSHDSAATILYGLLPGLTIGVLHWRASTQATGRELETSAQRLIQILAFVVIVRVARRVVHDSLTRQSVALDSMHRLTSANSLLFALHKVAQSLPASLDLEDVLRSTIANARSLLPTETIVILICDETTGRWDVARAEGSRLPSHFEAAELPTAVSAASKSTAPIRLSDLPSDDQRGFSSACQSGMYAPLRSRQSLFGVLAIEHSQAGLDTDDNVELLRRLAEPASLAIDNARWFGRIRRVAADEERVRIARDLHDRIGQSLAYLGFELDRIGHNPNATAVRPDISRLRSDVSRVIAEIRETLYDIRTEVTVEKDATGTIREFLDRVKGRNPDLQITFDQQVTGQLPARQEREMWLIAQEAILNVERHAMATALHVDWSSDGHNARLVVSDNGRGFASVAGRLDSYGLRGLRERAGAIGAHMEITSAPDKGTTIICRLD